jgi:phosphonopyruvate decarboxylase
MNSKALCHILRELGYNFFSGVPCSLLKGILSELESDPTVLYLPAVREDAAMGVAAGAYLGGKQPAVLMQNSGLGTGLTALTSLHLIYRIPLLMVVSWRGYGKDAPEHWIMGKKTEQILKEIDIPAFIPEPDGVKEKLLDATELMKLKEQPVAVILRKGIIS